MKIEMTTATGALRTMLALQVEAHLRPGIEGAKIDGQLREVQVLVDSIETDGRDVIATCAISLQTTAHPPVRNPFRAMFGETASDEPEMVPASVMIYARVVVGEYGYQVHTYGSESERDADDSWRGIAGTDAYGITQRVDHFGAGVLRG